MSQAIAGGGTPTTGSAVPGWLGNLASLGWRLLAIAGLIVVLWLLAGLLWTVSASVAIAVVISALFAPWTLGLRKRGRSRTGAAAIVWVGALAAVAGVALLLGWLLVPYVADLLRQIAAAQQALADQIASLPVPPFVVTLLGNVVDGIKGAVSGAVSDLVGSIAGAVTVVILAAFLVFFFLRDGDLAWYWCFQGVDEDKRHRITTAGEDALGRVGGYLRGTTVLSAIIAVTDYAFMVVLGVPLAGALAVLVFLGGYIPYFGGVVTTAIMLAVTYSALGIGPTVVMLLLIGIRGAILGYGIRPMIYGRTVSIHPALVLIVLPAGLQLAGVVGLFAAVPVAAVILAVSQATVAIIQPDEPPPLPGLVAPWVDRLAQWSWRLLVAVALVGVIVGVFVSVPMVVLPVVLGGILAATFEPVVRWLIGRGRSRARAAAISIGGGFLAILVMLVLAFAVLLEQGVAIGQDVVNGADQASGTAGGQLGLAVNAVRSLANGGLETITTVASEAASVLAIVVLSSLLAFYFLRDGSGLWGRVVARARPEVAGDVQAAGTRAFEVLGGYMFGTAVISFVGALSQLVIMLVLGIPLALPIFVLSFFLCFIPYIGGFISTGAALLVTVAVGSTADIAVMAVWTVAFNLVTGNIVSPLVYGKTVHLHPAIVLVAIPAGSAVAGILGMFLVVPALGVVSAVWRTVLKVMAAQASAAAPAADGGGGGGPDSSASARATAVPDSGPTAKP